MEIFDHTSWEMSDILGDLIRTSHLQIFNTKIYTKKVSQP